MFGKKIKSNNFSPNSFSYRGSYFKYRGEGSQILWIRFGGSCQAGCCPRSHLIFVWVRACKFFGFVLGLQGPKIDDIFPCYLGSMLV